MISSTQDTLQTSENLAASQTFLTDSDSEQQKSLNAFSIIEVIKSSTPLVLAGVGCMLGLFVLRINPDTEMKTAGLSLASTAIAGAAGLAQSHNSQD